MPPVSLRDIAETAVRPPIVIGTVTVAVANDYTVQVPGHVDQNGVDVPFEHLRSLARKDHSAGAQVAVCYTNWNRPRDGALWVILDEIGRTSSSTPSIQVASLWPMHRQNQWRTAIALGETYGFSVVSAAVNAVSTRFARTSRGQVYQIGSSIQGYEDDGTQLGQVGTGLDVLQVLNEGARLYVVTDGTIYAFDLEAIDLVTPLAATTSGTWAGLVLEPLLLPSGLWVVDSSNPASWTWRRLNTAALSSALATAALAWDGWTVDPNLPNSAPGGPYPIVLSTEPVYSHEASDSPAIQPLVLSAGRVIPPGDDADFLTLVRDQRADQMSYEGTEIPYTQERSQVLCVDPAAGTRAWSFDGWGDFFAAGSKGAATPVCVANGQVIAHYSRIDHGEITFQHVTGDPSYIEPLGTAITDWIALAAHISFSWYLPSVNGPWGYDDFAPEWSWNPNYQLQPLIDALVAGTETIDVSPGFGAEVTRDYQSNLTHGMVAIDGSGAAVASIEFSDPDVDSPYVTATDNGDALCSTHYVEEDPLEPDAFAPRTMYDGTITQIEVTISAATAAGYPDLGAALLDLGEITSLQDVFAYVAREEFTELPTGNTWTGTDGNPHTTFYQGHIWYGGVVDEAGITSISTAPFVDIEYQDIENDHRWDHYTVTVTYYCWIVTRVTVSTAWSETNYGFDPCNAVVSEETNTVCLLPRRLSRPPRETWPVYFPLWEQSHRDAMALTFDANGNVSGGGDGGVMRAAYGLYQFSGWNYTDTTFVGWDSWGDATIRELDRSQVNEDGAAGGAWTTANLATRQYGSNPVNTFMTRCFRLLFGYSNGGNPGGTQPSFVGADAANEAPNGVWNYYGPGHGYWYDGGDPLDDNNWTPVDWDSPSTGWRGIKGDVPRGGAYYPATPVGPPHIPAYGEGTPCTLLAFDATTMAEQWRIEFGTDIALSAPPVGVVQGDKLYLAMFAPAVQWLHISEPTGDWAAAFWVLVDDLTDTGTTIDGSGHTPEEWAALAATYPGYFRADGTLDYPALFEAMKLAAYLIDQRTPADVRDTGYYMEFPSQWTAPATVYQIDTTDGTILAQLEVEQAAGTQSLDLIGIADRMVLTGDDGRRDIT